MKTPAVNGRFCEMAAVTPQQRQCGLGSYYPAASAVKPPPRKAAGTIGGNERSEISAYQPFDAIAGVRADITRKNLVDW